MLQTGRLHLEPAGLVHLDLLAELNGDPEVMRHLLGRAATRAETEAEWAERLGPRTDTARGLGCWIGWHGGTFAGWWSASSFSTDASISGIGYRLRRSLWGRGLATEGARRLVTHAFGVPGIEACVASTMAVNAGSRRVLEKLGMTHVDTVHRAWAEPLPGAEQGEVVYRLERPSADPERPGGDGTSLP